MSERDWPEKDFAAELRTPLQKPWTERRFPADSDPRTPFCRDRDRIIHSKALQNLQHKTQVFIVHEADFYRTRLTHTLEVAQISRSTALMMGLQEALVEAIALAHDVGHTPFGHTGERALNDILQSIDSELGWNSNHYSLTLLDEGQPAGAEQKGLNLTFATRQGLARHQSPFDSPREKFDSYASPTLECQLVNIADFVAYSVHDVKDALRVGVLTLEELYDAPALRIWHRHLREAEAELKQGSPSPDKRGQQRLLAKRAGSNLIGEYVNNLVRVTHQSIQELGICSFEDVIHSDERLVRLSDAMSAAGNEAVNYMIERVYQSPLVLRQNFKAKHVLESLFEAFYEERGLLPRAVQRSLQGLSGAEVALQLARYIAGLTDRTALDLYAELFDPRERAMGYDRT